MANIKRKMENLKNVVLFQTQKIHKLQNTLETIETHEKNYLDLENKYELLKKAVSEYDRKIKILFDENFLLNNENSKLLEEIRKLSSLNKLALRRAGITPETMKTDLYAEIGFFGTNEKFRAGVGLLLTLGRILDCVDASQAD